jgi:hypothetical protein
MREVDWSPRSSLSVGTIIAFGQADADRPDPLDQAEMAKGLFDSLTLFWRARDDPPPATGAFAGRRVGKPRSALT